MLVWNSCFMIVEKVIVIETYFSLELVFFDESGPPLERVARVDCHPSILGNGWQPPVLTLFQILEISTLNVSCNLNCQKWIKILN